MTHSAAEIKEVAAWTEERYHIVVAGVGGYVQAEESKLPDAGVGSMGPEDIALCSVS